MDICCLTETWLRKGDTSKIVEIRKLGYHLFTQSRPGRGGGVAIAYKKHVKATKVTSKAFKSFEHVECLVKSSSNDLLRVCCLYRPGTSSNVADFCIDFDNYLEYLINLPGKLLICGDFNIHIEDQNCPDTQRFQTIVSNYGLLQHVSEPTHIHGGTLDLVLTRSNACDTLPISNLKVEQTATSSDHYFVGFSCKFDHASNKHEKVKVKARNLKEIDLASFKSDILTSDMANPEKYVDCNNAFAILQNELCRILDKHAPFKEFNVNPNQDAWVDSTCQEARRSRRKAERQNRNLQTDESKLAWKNACQHADTVIDTTLESFYHNKFALCNNDKKKTFQVVNNLMDREAYKNCYPNDKPSHVVATEMQQFFKEKVDKIYCEIEKNSTDVILKKPLHDFVGQYFMEFALIDETELKSIISELNKKNCELDPIPLNLFLECLDELKPILLYIVNASLKSATFPENLKNALVKPSIKDHSGDINDYQNYRPISNLSFISKIIEKCVHKQLTKHLECYKLHAEHQSGYRPNHSCETATLAIYNDLLCVTDKKNKVVLLLLDLSAAFDTVNHQSLLTKLYQNFGISGMVLKWFESYLKDRSFTVSVDNVKSSKCFIRIGVPQGSILGPILFILYTKDVEMIARKYGFMIHMYADDTQLYIEFNPIFHDIADIENKIILCLKEIKEWMIENYLCLNAGKTEAIIVKHKNNYDNVNFDSIKLTDEGKPIKLSTNTVKSLGIHFDQHLSFEEHVNKIVQTCNIHLRNLRVIGKKLSFNLKKQLIHCLIFSKLDYCNGLLYGLPNCLLKKLQKVQNSCVRFLFGRKIKKFDHVSPFLKEAHFLPIKQRIDYKIALNTFKCMNNIAPKYLRECIEVKGQPARILRNENDYFLLDFPSVANFQQTYRSFKYAAPAVWNLLPYHLRSESNILSFKENLKTHLFKNAFNEI